MGYLSDDVPNIRIPMGVLMAITGDTVPFHWGFMEQRAFEDVKAVVHAAWTQSQVPINYARDTLQVWVIMDGCNSGILGLISQGADWWTAKVATFYSVKLNSAQQNYLVHEVEMLAGVETMLRHRDVLLGVHFKWLTDHKGLVHLLKQKNLSGRQAWWLEKIAIFNYDIEYVSGSENILANALSWIYAADSVDLLQSRSEYTYFDVIDNDGDSVIVTRPAIVAVHTRHMDVESRHAKTSREFAAKMRGCFWLRGPVPQREGKPTMGAENAEQTPKEAGVNGQPSLTQRPLMDLVSISSDGINLMNEFQGNYS